MFEIAAADEILEFTDFAHAVGASDRIIDIRNNYDFGICACTKK